MKTRFNTFDVKCNIAELQRLVGMRVNNIYDIDNKTYLIKLQKPEAKSVLLLESGNRFHTTAFEWPKNVAPSGFSMKLRKHLRNKRLESLQQIGVDRIVDLQFGIGEAAYHVILELYDRGNLILADYEWTILNILRPHTENETIRLAVKEKYKVERARDSTGPPSVEELKEILGKSKPAEPLKKVLNPKLDYGATIIEHVLLEANFPGNVKIRDFKTDEDFEKLYTALKSADELFKSTPEPNGYIIQKREERPTEEKAYIDTNQDFTPILFAQHKTSIFKEFDSFDTAIDEYFSTMESQKIDLRALQQEREAMKKLDNVRKDHSQRLEALEKTQEVDKQRAELITRNQILVDSAILAVQSALATQISWPDIEALVKAAQEKSDPVASAITQLKLDKNHITLRLKDPYVSSDTETDEPSDLPPMDIDIDLALSAFANARKYYDLKRNAALKKRKTLESQTKAFKSAEKKTLQTLKEVQTITSINKARKVYWFEKFFWFVSSENYLVIGGRDQQQNELIVKRYMRPGDIYVHADIHGASSVVVKNPKSDEPIPPKTLNEAGVMAICYSVAWEAKVVTSAWWVNANQVSKTAPTGEYLTTGAFIIRGKKNFLPPCHLIMGFSFLFKLEDGSVSRHAGERRKRTEEEDLIAEVESTNIEEEVELEASDQEDKDEEEQSEFPDTQIKIEHFGGTEINIRTEGSNIIQNNEYDDEDDDNDENRVIFLGDNKPILLSQRSNQKTNYENKVKTQKILQEKSKETKQPPVNQLKRGQKGKLKKIKEKYKDQDDEERQLRMEILQSAGTKKNKKHDMKNQVSKSKKSVGGSTAVINKSKPVIKNEDDEEEIVAVADVDMLDSLTGVPHPEDELLFAIPVVAPYNTLTNYKYKVKLTPGTGRRGKAAKTAISVFLRDRMATQREKDLLKSVKDENVARNLPGKVKVSAPKIQNFKK